MIRRYALAILIMFSWRSCALTETEKTAVVEVITHAYLANQKKLNIIQFIVLKLQQHASEVEILSKRVEELEAKLAARDISLKELKAKEEAFTTKNLNYCE